MATKKWRFAIREKLNAAGFPTAYSLEKATGKPNAQAGRWLDPDRVQINIDTVNELCELLDCTPGDLFAEVKPTRRK